MHSFSVLRPTLTNTIHLVISTANSFVDDHRSRVQNGHSQRVNTRVAISNLVVRDRATSVQCFKSQSRSLRKHRSDLESADRPAGLKNRNTHVAPKRGKPSARRAERDHAHTRKANEPRDTTHYPFFSLPIGKTDRTSLASAYSTVRRSSRRER